MKGLSLLALAIVALVLVSGCAGPGAGARLVTSSNNSPNLSSTPQPQSPSQTPNKSLSPSSVIGTAGLADLNLQLSDLPPNYLPNATGGGVSASASDYARGDAFRARWLSDYGWAGASEADYLKSVRNGTGIARIYGSISVFKNATFVDCGLKQYGLESAGNGETLRPAGRVYGDASALYSFALDGQASGRVEGYELRFYYGNALVDMVLSGPRGEMTLLDVNRYASLIEQRLEAACPGCEKAPKCPRRLEFGQ